MRVAILTEGGYPYASGEARLWCDRLVRGLAGHDFEVYALSRSARQEADGWAELPAQVRRVRTAPLWGDRIGGPQREPRDAQGVHGAHGAYGRRERRRFGAHFEELAAAVTAADSQADRFASGLYGLADLARERDGLPAALRSEQAVRILERACRTTGAHRGAYDAQVTDLLTVAELLERALRPLSLDWYGDGAGPGDRREDTEGGDGDGSWEDEGPGLSGVELCHATSGGSAAIPGLLAKRFFGTPLLVTEYGVRLREHYLESAGGAARPGARAGVAASSGPRLSVPVRTLLAAFRGHLASEVYSHAALITPGNAHARRWQERCGADPARLRTVHPGMDASPFAEVGEGGAAEADDGRTLVWVGRVEPAKDVVALLHAFARVRRAVPDARLRIVRTGPPGDGGPDPCDYPAHCRALAAQLFPDEAAHAHAVGDNPVSFETLGDPEAPSLPEVYAAASVVVLSSVVEGFPGRLVESMFAGRATVSTDVGAVREVIGGTGLVVPPRNPQAFADACGALLRDPARRERLGAAARARALELFTVEQNLAAFRGIYLELISHSPVRREEVGADGAPLPFARPPEAHVPGRWAVGHPVPASRGVRFGPWSPGWAAARPTPDSAAARSAPDPLADRAPHRTTASPQPLSAREPLGAGPRFRLSEEGA